MIVFIRHLKINKISAIFFTFLLVSKYAFSEQIINQDVDITSGSTLSNASGLTIHESSGGPFIIDNEGTIEAKFQYQELSFKDMSETNLYINYKYSF